MTEQNQPIPVSVPLPDANQHQAALDIYSEAMAELLKLVKGAHNLSHTAAGQNLRPVVTQFMRLGGALMPVGTPGHDAVERLRSTILNESGGASATEAIKRQLKKK